MKKTEERNFEVENERKGVNEKQRVHVRVFIIKGNRQKGNRYQE